MWEIRAEHGEKRYGAFVVGELVGQAACVRIGDAVAVSRIRVDAAFRGLGIGSDLARSICRDAREQDLRVLALCPFMRRWGQAHPQYGEVLHAAGPHELAAMAPFAGTAELDEELRLQTRSDGRVRR
jgi:predicted GNAT family acetyltransferase